MNLRGCVVILLFLALPFAAGSVFGVYGVPIVRAHFQHSEDLPTAALVIPPSFPALQFDDAPATYANAPKNPPPASVLVGPYRWKIKYVKFGPAEFGRDYPKPLEIQLDPTLPRDQLVETLVHEIMHTCLFVGNGGSVSMEGNKYSDDEFIEQAAPTLMQVLRDNPELVAWLQEKN